MTEFDPFGQCFLSLSPPLSHIHTHTLTPLSRSLLLPGSVAIILPQIRLFPSQIYAMGTYFSLCLSFSSFTSTNPIQSLRHFDSFYSSPLGFFVFYFQIVCIVGGQTFHQPTIQRKDRAAIKMRALCPHSLTHFSQLQPVPALSTLILFFLLPFDPKRDITTAKKRMRHPLFADKPNTNHSFIKSSSFNLFILLIPCNSQLILFLYSLYFFNPSSFPLFLFSFLLLFFASFLFAFILTNFISSLL